MGPLHYSYLWSGWWLHSEEFISWIFKNWNSLYEGYNGTMPHHFIYEEWESFRQTIIGLVCMKVIVEQCLITSYIKNEKVSDRLLFSNIKGTLWKHNFFFIFILKLVHRNDLCKIEPCQLLLVASLNHSSISHIQECTKTEALLATRNISSHEICLLVSISKSRAKIADWDLG